MIRKIINIDREKCNGCGLCVEACHEGAIGLVDGVATLLRDDYCDGLGDCLPACPTGAITFTEREALPYDEAAVAANIAEKTQGEASPQPPKFTGCPGTMAKKIAKEKSPKMSAPGLSTSGKAQSELSQWPVQLKLVPVNAPYFDKAKLLVAADCTAFTYGNFHQEFIKDRVTLIGCPKLDMVEYAEKLTEIIKENEIKDVTVVRMEVPCCGGIEQAVKQALVNSGKMIPWQVVTVGIDGELVSD